MVLKGYINFTGEPINLAENSQREMLRIIETGAIPYYKWSYESSSQVMNTKFNELYDIDYNQWLEESITFYKRVNDVLKEVQGQSIVKHKKLSKNLYKTIYDSGKAIIVNYNQKQVKFDNFKIGGEDFVFLREVEENGF
jgi:hypothetical protein